MTVGTRFEHGQAQYRLDARAAAFDGTRHTAGLPVQVEAQAELVHVLERLQRHAPHHALLDGGKHRIPQLAETGRGQAQQAVDDDQPDGDRQHTGSAAVVRQRVHRARVEHRDVYVGDLGQHQERHGGDHAYAGAKIVLRPEKRRQRLYCFPVGPGLAWQGQSVRRHHSHEGGCGMGRAGFKGLSVREGRKAFFFAKKKQKTLVSRLHRRPRQFRNGVFWRNLCAPLRKRGSKRFLVLFSKKGLLSSLLAS